MKRKMGVFIFLTLVFILPMFATAYTDPYPNDSYRLMPENLIAGGSEVMEILWSDEGNLIYWHIDTDRTLRLYLVNLSVFEAKQWDRPIYSAQIEAGNTFDHKIVLPYNDTFYIRLENVDEEYAIIDGWYAVDQGMPEGNMWGISTNHANELKLGTIVTLGCLFTDNLGLSTITLYENDVEIQTITVTDLVEHTWVKGNYEFTTLGEVEIKYTATDMGGNVGEVSRTFEVVEQFSPSPTTTEPFDWVGIFEEHWVAMIAISVLIGVIVIVSLEKAGKLP